MSTAAATLGDYIVENGPNIARVNEVNGTYRSALCLRDKTVVFTIRSCETGERHYVRMIVTEVTSIDETLVDIVGYDVGSSYGKVTVSSYDGTGRAANKLTISKRPVRPRR